MSFFQSVLDRFSVNEDDDFEDDLFEEDMEDVSADADDDLDDFDDEPAPAKPSPFAAKPAKKPSSKANRANKIVQMNRTANIGDLRVIKPEEFDDAQLIIKVLQNGLAVIINLEGMDVPSAQRIVDFVAGGVTALDGSLQAISGSIFVAAPNNVEVSGDLREGFMYGANVSSDI